MRVEFFDQLKNITRATASRVVIYDDYSNPVALLIHLGPKHIRIHTVADKDFQTVLDDYGIRGAKVLTEADIRRISVS